MTLIQVLPEWEQLNPAEMAGTIVVIGQTDSGKSTFTRWLVNRLCQHHERVGWIDADVGQSTLGLPTTMNLAVVSEPLVKPPPPNATFFVGDVSPRGHMLPMVVGVKKLQERARQLETNTLVVDTTGLVTQEAGGGALKQWKIALLEPAIVVAIQRHGELVHILTPLIRNPTLKVHILPVAKAVARRPVEDRVKRRQEQFRRYFADAAPLKISYSRLPVYGLEQVGRHRLVALQDRSGFTLALGVIMEISAREMVILTPARDAARTVSLRTGSLLLNPDTGAEPRPGKG